MLALLRALCAGEDVVAGVVLPWARLVAKAGAAALNNITHKVRLTKTEMRSGFRSRVARSDMSLRRIGAWRTVARRGGGACRSVARADRWRWLGLWIQLAPRVLPLLRSLFLVLVTPNAAAPLTAVCPLADPNSP